MLSLIGCSALSIMNKLHVSAINLCYFCKVSAKAKTTITLKWMVVLFDNFQVFVQGLSRSLKHWGNNLRVDKNLRMAIHSWGERAACSHSCGDNRWLSVDLFNYGVTPFIPGSSSGVRVGDVGVNVSRSSTGNRSFCWIFSSTLATFNKLWTLSKKFR